MGPTSLSNHTIAILKRYNAQVPKRQSSLSLSHSLKQPQHDPLKLHKFPPILDRQELSLVGAQGYCAFSEAAVDLLCRSCEAKAFQSWVQAAWNYWEVRIDQLRIFFLG